MTKAEILITMATETDINKLKTLRDQYEILAIASRGCLENMASAARNTETYIRILQSGWEDAGINDKIQDMNVVYTNALTTLNNL